MGKNPVGVNGAPQKTPPWLKLELQAKSHRLDEHGTGYSLHAFRRDYEQLQIDRAKQRSPTKSSPKLIAISPKSVYMLWKTLCPESTRTVSVQNEARAAAGADFIHNIACAAHFFSTLDPDHVTDNCLFSKDVTTPFLGDTDSRKNTTLRHQHGIFRRWHLYAGAVTNHTYFWVLVCLIYLFYFACKPTNKINHLMFIVLMQLGESNASSLLLC